MGRTINRRAFYLSLFLVCGAAFVYSQSKSKPYEIVKEKRLIPQIKDKPNGQSLITPLTANEFDVAEEFPSISQNDSVTYESADRRGVAWFMYRPSSSEDMSGILQFSFSHNGQDYGGLLEIIGEDNYQLEFETHVVNLNVSFPADDRIIQVTYSVEGLALDLEESTLTLFKEGKIEEDLLTNEELAQVVYNFKD